MKGQRVVALASLALLMTVCRPVHADGEGVPDHGFLLKLGLGAAYSPAHTFPYPSLVAGYRLIDRLEIHLALGFAAETASSTSTTGVKSSAEVGIFTVAPGVLIDAARFLNKKVVLYVNASLPLGAWFGGAGGGTGTAFAIGFGLGLGVRYAIVPIFTLGLEGGVAGLFAVGVDSSGGSGASSLVGFYGALVGTLYFGK